MSASHPAGASSGSCLDHEDIQFFRKKFYQLLCNFTQRFTDHYVHGAPPDLKAVPCKTRRFHDPQFAKRVDNVGRHCACLGTCRKGKTVSFKNMSCAANVM